MSRKIKQMPPAKKVEGAIELDGRAAFQQMLDQVAGIILFMKVAMDHGTEYLQAGHPEYESKRELVWKEIEDFLKDNEAIKGSMEEVTMQMMGMLTQQIVSSMAKVEKDKIITSASIDAVKHFN